MEDKNFAERLNILRAGVLGANDGIISIAGVVIGVASATSNIWFILISALSAIFAGAFSMAGGEYVSVSTQKDTEEAAVAKEQALLDRSPESARESLYQTFLSQGDCETEAEVKVNQAFSKNPIKVMSSILTGRIYAGRVNPKNQMFIGERDDVTDTAVSAVAQHLLKEEICLQFEVKGKTYRLEVREVEA